MSTAEPVRTGANRLARPSERAPRPAPKDETASNRDASLGGRIESDHDGHRHRQDDDGCAAFPSPVSPREHNGGDPSEHRDGEGDAAGPREPKPLTEPSPVASNHGRDARS